jgi:hypothetical protein
MGWWRDGRRWMRESLLKPAFRRLSAVEHPPQLGQGLDALEQAYRRLTRKPPRVATERPFVLVLAWGLSDQGLGELADELERVCQAFGGWQPLIVTDCTALDALGAHDFKVEHIPARDDWCAVEPAQGWPDYLSGRLAHLRSVYRPIGTLLLVSDGDLSGLRHGIGQVFTSG